MKILVMSDSHGNTDAMCMAVSLESPDLILHLGDHDRDCAVVADEFAHIPLRAVRGNCDFVSTEPETYDFTLGGKRFFMTHGHLYGVKRELRTITDTAVGRAADVLLFGHTHSSCYAKEYGIDIINPGSIGTGKKTYAVLEIKNGMLICNIKRL